MSGAAVRLEMSGNPKCKTKYDLVMVYKCELAGARLLHLADAKLLGSLKSSLETPLLRKRGLGWVNIDSQAPNKVVGEWLSKQEFGTALAEAKAAGVSVLFLLCHVGRDSLEIVEQREG